MENVEVENTRGALSAHGNANTLQQRETERDAREGEGGTAALGLQSRDSKESPRFRHKSGEAIQTE